jgi:hypothetical protein
MIASQMMKGANGNVRQCNLAGTKEQMEEFKENYKNIIEYIEKTIPKSVSAAVCGAIGKAVLWYGKDVVDPFIKAFASKAYNGVDDPVHVLWQWLIMNKKRNNTNEIYRRTVTALRAYLRRAAKDIRLTPAKNDIFEWGDDYCIMIQPRANQHTKLSRKSPKKIIERTKKHQVPSVTPLD